MFVDNSYNTPQHVVSSELHQHAVSPITSCIINYLIIIIITLTSYLCVRQICIMRSDCNVSSRKRILVRYITCHFVLPKDRIDRIRVLERVDRQTPADGHREVETFKKHGKFVAFEDILSESLWLHTIQARDTCALQVVGSCCPRLDIF